MNKQSKNEVEWKTEKFWIKVEKERLYPPEQLKIKSAKELIKDEDLRNKKVLDNGCGTGWFGKITQEMGAKVVGTDISQPLLNEASKNFAVKKANSYKLPFKDYTFDYVLFFMVLHVLDRPEKAIKETHRVLKIDGKLILGIVHSKADKWDVKTGCCFRDKSSITIEETRPWVFNLLNGEKFTKHYIHRSWSFYESILSKYFKIERKLEPKISKKMTRDNKYASTEFLFIKLIKK